MARCEECGYDWDAGPKQLAEHLRIVPDRFRAPLTRFLAGENPDRVVRTRPAPAVWSALEYTAHTRDAVAFYDGRVERVLLGDRPQLSPFDADAACADRRYNQQAVTWVLDELHVGCDRLAARITTLDEPQWQQVGIGSAGDERTVLALVRRAVHEGHHHLLDVGRVLRRVRGRDDRNPPGA
jgi:hypothetical protein